MKEFTDIELQRIEDYVLDRLDPTERILFETQLATDADLREEVEKTRRVQEAAVQSKLRNKIKHIQADKLTEWKAEEATHLKIVEKPRRNTWRLPATFAAAASVLFACYLALSPVSLPNTDIISERGNASTDSVQTEVLTKYSTAITAFQNEDFTTAATLFDEIATNPNIRPYYQEAATWYGGVARINTDPAAAEVRLDSVISKEDKEFKVSTLDRMKVWWQLQLSKMF